MSPERESELFDRIERMEAMMVKTMELAASVEAQVAPIVDRLSNHPMFKMFVGGK